MRLAKLKVVHSAMRRDLLSLRGPLGRNAGDPVHQHITDAGFHPDEEVVLIAKEDFDTLRAAATLARALAEDIEGEPEVLDLIRKASRLVNGG